MTCSDYHILISAKLDEEITAEEEQQLAEHLRICPSCRSYASLLEAAFSTGQMTEPPAGLRDSILQKAAEMPVPKQSAGKKRALRIISAFAAAAACIVLCVAAVPIFLPKGASADSAAYEAADMAVYSAETAMDDCAPAEAYSTFTTDDTAAADTEAAAPIPEPEEDSFQSDRAASDAGALATGLPAPEEGTLAVITCEGPLPEMLDSAEHTEVSADVYYIYIDITQAQKLTDLGYPCSVDAETLISLPEDGKAAVLWLP